MTGNNKLTILGESFVGGGLGVGPTGPATVAHQLAFKPLGQENNIGENINPDQKGERFRGL